MASPLLAGCHSCSPLLTRAGACSPSRIVSFCGHRHFAVEVPQQDKLFSVAGKSVVITGGAQGIGRALAAGFAERGCSLFVLDLRADDAERCAKDLRTQYPACSSAVGIPCDVQDECAVRSATKRVHEECEHVDVLINCAGVTKRMPAEEFPLREFDRIQNTNVRGSWCVSTNFGAEMMKSRVGASIINIDSFVTASLLSGVLPYSMSKASIQALTKGLALEWGDRGIRVNGIAPGLILTPISQALWSQPHMEQWAHEQTPMRRMGDVDDLVGTALFLASPAARFISGQTIRVDGGLSAGRHWPIDGPSSPRRQDSRASPTQMTKRGFSFLSSKRSSAIQTKQSREFATASAAQVEVQASFFYKVGSMVANPFEGDGVKINTKAGRIAGFEHSVHNGRMDAELVCRSGRGLASRGISLQQHGSTFRNYRDDAEIKAHYYPELLDEACRLTGASKAIVASHVKRSVDAPGSTEERDASIRPGAFLVHGDFNNDLKEQLLAMLAEGKPCLAGDNGLGLSENELQAGRLMVLNFWKPMSAEPVCRAPMAVCDASSMSSDDIDTYAHDPKPPPQNYTLPLPNLLTISTTSPDHRWFYFPGMTNEEWIVFKTYDSAGPQPGNGVGVHSSFNDPRTRPTDPSRESIEARVVCFIAPSAETEADDTARWQRGSDELTGEPPPMENVERLAFYKWLESEEWEGPVGLTAKFTIPNDKVEIYLDIMRANIAGTRLEEGMIHYDLVPDYIPGTAGSDKTVYWLLERFKTKQDLLLHVQSSHYKRCQQRFLDDMGGHPLVQIACYRIEPIEPKPIHAIKVE